MKPSDKRFWGLWGTAAAFWLAGAIIAVVAGQVRTWLPVFTVLGLYLGLGLAHTLRAARHADPEE
ncbi:MAG: hypothetical protein KDB73_16225 [Planctomycetes bacterium]|nr:hypothetical protein [Planctomycetota bacterium]